MRNEYPIYTFSVIIPTYNRAERLKISLESLSEQTFKNFEVLVCDDGSTDHTKEVVESFKEKLDITYTWEENWGGPARPRNNGIKLSKGEWICFLDSDDWWYPEKLATVNEFINANNEIDFICHSLTSNNISTGNKQIIKSGPIVSNLYKELLISGNRFLNSAISIRKSTLKKYGVEINESRDFVSVEDFELCLQLAMSNIKFACLDISLGEYTIEDDNISNTKKHLVNLELMLKFHVFEKQTFEPDKKKLWREVRCRRQLHKANLSLINRNYYDLFLHTLSAFYRSPNTFINYFLLKNLAGKVHE